MSASGIELLIMAINLHLGGAPSPRPGIFRWQGASGREVLVMNGNHYTMFDQILYAWDNSLERMEQGLAEYDAGPGANRLPPRFPLPDRDQLSRRLG